jgi:hypothetical protein
MVSNALCAAGAAVALGLPLDVVATALSGATPRSPWRMEVTRPADGVTVVNDAYNANPDSTRAALDTVARMVDVRRTTVPDAKLFVVLGDMLELGEDTAYQHTSIGRYAAESGAVLVLAVGAEAQHVVSGAVAGGADALRLTDKSEALASAQRTASRRCRSRQGLAWRRPGDRRCRSTGSTMLSILTAGAIALAITLFGTRFLIQFLSRRGYGQFIRDDGPTEHHTKRGTPTMGGVIIIVAVVLRLLRVAPHLLAGSSGSALLALFLFVGLGFVGFLDDWTKIRQGALPGPERQVEAHPPGRRRSRLRRPQPDVPRPPRRDPRVQRGVVPA